MLQILTPSYTERDGVSCMTDDIFVTQFSEAIYGFNVTSNTPIPNIGFQMSGDVLDILPRNSLSYEDHTFPQIIAMTSDAKYCDDNKGHSYAEH